jgi:ribosomal protein S18 acetylase RimI-like enzyme
MDTLITVRPYQPEDRPAIRRICYLTGFMGGPVGWYWRDFESFANIWTSYYTGREPESTFVVLHAGRLVGYLLGCVDTRRAPSDMDAFLSQMIRRFLLFRPGTAGFFWRCLFDLLRGNPIPENELDLTRFPSHLHIDLLPEARRMGAGSALMHSWFDKLATVGSPGCHLGTLAENAKAIAFFERMGFRRFCAPLLIPGMRSPEGTRLHEQLMVREIMDTSL